MLPCAPQTPEEVSDIGTLGEHTAAFLYRLKAIDKGRPFEAVRRTLQTLVPSVEELRVELNTQRGELELFIVQDGIAYSSRVVSEGTLRILALCSIVASPFARTLVAYEEPENGVHPRRIQLVAQLLVEMVKRGRQVLVTTHSPIFVGEVVRLVREEEAPVILYSVVREAGESKAIEFQTEGPIFTDDQVRRALADGTDEAVVVGALLRGWLDE